LSPEASADLPILPAALSSRLAPPRSGEPPSSSTGRTPVILSQRRRISPLHTETLHFVQGDRYRPVQALFSPKYDSFLSSASPPRFTSCGHYSLARSACQSRARVGAKHSETGHHLRTEPFFRVLRPYFVTKRRSGGNVRHTSEASYDYKEPATEELRVRLEGGVAVVLAALQHRFLRLAAHQDDELRGFSSLLHFAPPSRFQASAGGMRQVLVRRLSERTRCRRSVKPPSVSKAFACAASWRSRK